MKRIILAVILAGAMLAGCGGGGKPVAYRPVAYGENAQCYYVNSPAETVALQAQGLCQAGWVPTLMPVYWHQRYYPYYSSPAYYNTYVPAPDRSSYATSERTWGSTNKTAIATATKEARYQGSNGKTVTADKIGASKYGGGARFGPAGTKFGGGSGRAESPSPATTKANSPSNNSPSPPKASPSPPKASPSKPASPPKSVSPSKPSSGGSKSYGGGSGRPSSGGSYGGGGGRPSGGGSYGGGKR